MKDKTKNKAKKLAPEIASEVVKAFRREVGCDSERRMGLRRSEVCGLRWIDIDFQQKTMRIRHTVTQNGDLILDEDHTKTKRSNRTLVLLDETIPYLKELLAKQKEAGLVMDKVVAWMNGKKVQPNSITRMFHTFLRKRGMGHIRFHDLRHTAATLLANNGTQLKVLQNFLGHNDVKVTLGVYTHDPENAGAQAASSMGQVFKKTFCSETCSERQLLAQER